jgi:molybdenum cofactor cytidylyltransferase
MGREKALLPWPAATHASTPLPGQTLLSAAISALRPVTEEVIVVAGKNAAALAPAVCACGAYLVVNPDPDRGQFSSLQTGLREAVARGFDAAMIMPVDCPPLAAVTLQRLREAFFQAVAAGKWAVAPVNQAKHGHPLVAGRQLIDAFLSAPVLSSARDVKHAHESATEYVPVDEPLLTVDLNTPEQYAALLRERGSGPAPE